MWGKKNDSMAHEFSSDMIEQSYSSVHSHVKLCKPLKRRCFGMMEVQVEHLLLGVIKAAMTLSRLVPFWSCPLAPTSC